MRQTVLFRGKRHVILGNSAAALSAIKAIRGIDSASPITLISAEPHYAYSPVLLTYYVSQRIDRKALFIADQHFYHRLGVDLILGNKAVKVDPENQRIYLEKGEILEYDTLLLATGSKPKQLGIAGEDLEGIFTLKTVDDGDKLLKYSEQIKDVVIIGGGLIGLQAANALVRDDRKITMVIGSKQPLSQNVDPACAENVCQGIRDCGISIRFESNAVAVERVKQKLKVELNLGRALKADAVVIGKGVKPNIQLAEASGIEVNHGIVVDASMRTNCSNIFAAGDVAEGMNQITGERQVIATWPNACAQGKTAGLNMSGARSTFSGLSYNVCNFLGRTVASVGVAKPENGDYDEVIYREPMKGLYRKLVWNKKDELVGAVLMGKVEDIGVIRNLIKNRTKFPKTRRDRMVRTAIKYGECFSQKTGQLQC